MKVNWKVRFKFVKSLRFRILVILIIIGIVPSIIVEKGIVNSYEDRAVSNRQLNVKNQCDYSGQSAGKRELSGRSVFGGDQQRADDAHKRVQRTDPDRQSGFSGDQGHL